MKTDEDDFKPSPQMDWILSGVFLGYTLTLHPDSLLTRYIFISPEGEMKENLVVPTAKANELYTNGYLALDMTTSTFKLTNKGFDRAHDRIRKAVGKPTSDNFVG